ncbi:MAG: hypothetical protein GX564_03240 [Oligosphaeraceae bacterium]|nr:hypothetical protein [Oligosphaeraceae bacterium]
MIDDFNAFQSAFNQQSMQVFSDNGLGTLWLKLKSIMRSDCIQGFAQQSGLTLSDRPLKDKFRAIFTMFKTDVPRGHALLDAFLRHQHAVQLRMLDEEAIIAELYKLQYYAWGGDYQNSLDRFLVTKYIKHPFYTYDELCRNLDTDIKQAVRGYLLNSWYNHWSSIVIEHIFKAHPGVLPTVGQIKGVDFFLANIPFDLKITYFPSEFMKLCRQQRGLPPEITYLKQQARRLSLRFDSQQSEAGQLQQITARLKDLPEQGGSEVLRTLSTQRREILAQTQQNPQPLLRWLYEHQGERRFGAENRLFLILVDSEDFSRSWELKRNIAWIRPQINAYLDACLQELGQRIMPLDFSFAQQHYHVLTDALFLVK